MHSQQSIRQFLWSRHRSYERRGHYFLRGCANKATNRLRIGLKNHAQRSERSHSDGSTSVTMRRADSNSQAGIVAAQSSASMTIVRIWVNPAEEWPSWV